MKEIVCIICIGVGGAEVRSDKCDFVNEILNGPAKEEFKIKRNDSRGAYNTRRLLNRTHEECKKEQGDTLK